MIKVIKASAGSGKTYQLTREYIKLLLGVKRKGRYELVTDKDNERHRHILAVTFTNKATAEMKERIVKELSILAGEVPGKRSDYIDYLCAEFGGVSEEAVQKAAYKAMVEILFDYTNFNVSTIDAFFQLVLRTFAKELKMSYNYDIEIDDDYAIKVGLNDFFSSLTYEKSSKPEDVERALRAKGWIKEFVRNEVNNGNSWNIFTATQLQRSKKSKGFSLNNFMDCLNKEDMRRYLDEVVEYIDKKDGERKPNYYISLFKDMLNGLMDKQKSRPVEAKKTIFLLSRVENFTEEDVPGRGGLLWLKNLKETDDKCNIEDIDIKKVQNSFSGSDSWFKTKKSGKEKITLSDSTIGAIVEQLKIIAESVNLYHIYRDMHRNVFMLGMLGEVKRYMEKYRNENEMILLGDTNDLLRKIINNDETPFVYERVGVWLSHFLIDEFQDTSRSQWENMKPLLFNSCAEGSDNLIIGDEKQCIYRFRNADSSLLRTEVGKNFTTQNDDSNNYNWRSLENVVEFNNEFFTYLADKLNESESYSNVCQLIPEKKKNNPEKGYVEINYIDAKAEQTANTEEGESEGKFKPVVLDRLPELIKDIISRGYSYKDIAILVFSNSEGVDVVQHIISHNAKREAGEPEIKVVSNESLQLKSSASVRLIISHLRYLDTKFFVPTEEGDTDDGIERPLDREGYAHKLLRNYEHLIYHEGYEPGVALEKSFETVPKNIEEGELSLYSLLPDNTESFNIVSITEHIIAQNIEGEKLEAENIFIQAFQDCVVDFSNRANASIHDFLKWWDKGGCNTSVNTPEGADAINVLTIHKSKGLEFKCVILPFCNWSLDGKEEVLWVPKENIVGTGLFEPNCEHLIPPVVPIYPKKEMSLSEGPLKDFYKEKLQERILDALNKTYVGFTRAVNEMYIFTPKSEEGKNMKLESFLAKMRDGNDTPIYTKGEKGYKVVSEKREDKAKETKMEEQALDLPNKMPIYNVNNVKLEYKVVDLYTNERCEQGIRLHNVLQRIKTIDDVDYALFYSKVKGIIPQEYYETESRLLREALNYERVKWWFDKKNRVYNERSLLDEDGTITRPDRFFTTPDGRTIVIDYKFGSKTPKKVKEYCEQVQGYMNVLRKVGMPNVEGYLWFPLEGNNDNAIVEVK